MTGSRGAPWFLWGVAWLLLLGCRADASDTAGHSSEDATIAKKPQAEQDDPLADLEHRAFPLLVWAAYIVDTEYFDRSRFDPRAQLVSAVTLLGLHTPEFFAEVKGGDTLHVTVRSRTAEFSLAELSSLTVAADRLEEVLVFTQDVLDLSAEPLHELEYAAINGLFAPLDPHTILLSPEEHDDLGVRTRGRFGGIGAQIRSEDRRIVIVKVLPDMPAARAGVLAGDVIMKIDGASTMNMGAAEAQERLRGAIGSVVALELRRGKTTLPVEIERDTIKIESVQTTMLPGGVAYMEMTTFQEDTADQLRAALQGASAGGRPPAGVVLDLRGNSGGLLAQATAVVDLFVRRGELVIVRSAVGREVDSAEEDLALDESVPLVLLVDEESASAAEIVTGGLSALGRGVTVGRSSFGKGTVQMVKPAEPYGRELALKLTVAEYLVAGDTRIQSLGVLPDLTLVPVEVSSIEGIARYYDVERFERRRERSRTANLPSAKHDPPIPSTHHNAARLRYLWTDELPTDLAIDGEPPEPLLDPEVRLARRIALGLAGTTTAADRRDRLAELAGALAAEEDERLTAALADARIDWSPGGPSSATGGDLLVRARVVEPLPVDAGAPFSLEIELENRGATPLHRVHAITECVHDELDGIELLVGRVDAGATQTRRMRLHVMPWHTGFIDRIGLDVHVGEPDDTADARAEAWLDVAGAPRPALAYDWWIVDDPALAAVSPSRPPVEALPGEAPWTIAGNGDGVLQAGERALLAFEVENLGAGDSPEVRAILANHSGDQGIIEEGAVDVGALAPGAVRTGAFGITMNERPDTSRPFELHLAIGDARMRTRAEQTLRIPIADEAAELAAEPVRLRVGEDGARLYTGGDASLPIVAELAAGTVIETSGRIGRWHRLDAGQGRRWYSPAGAALAPADAGATPLDASALPRRRSVLPPVLALEGTPKRTSEPQVDLVGIARHPDRVRDVVVLVRPPGDAQVEHKVFYDANAWTLGAEANALAFSAKVPLAEGGNRVTILARDGAKVEARHDVWIHRDAASR